MGKRPRILMVTPLPPPVNGNALVNQKIKDSPLMNETFNMDWVNISTSGNLAEYHKIGIKKICRYIHALARMLKLLILNRYDFCYFALTYSGVGFLKDAAFPLICKLFRHKLVFHQHNLGIKNYANKFPYKQLYSIIYKNAKVIVLSEFGCSDIEKVAQRTQAVVCLNGIDNIEIKPRQEYNGPVRLLFLSNLFAHKGIFVLLDALKILKERGVEFVCNVVGQETKYTSKDEFEDSIVKHGLSTSCGGG